MIKGSIGHTFVVCISTENQNQTSFCPFALRKVSVLAELALGHLCCHITDVPPQPNSPTDDVCCKHRRPEAHQLPSEAWFRLKTRKRAAPFAVNNISKLSSKVVVFQDRLPSHLCYTLGDKSQDQTRVKLNRVFFPR